MGFFYPLIILALLLSSPFAQAMPEPQPANAQTGQAQMRIIALSPHSVEMLYEIGAGDRIIGTLEYADYPEQALTIPRIGNFSGIQIEKVVELQPDLIIAWKSGNKSDDLDKLESLGFRIFYSHPEDIKGISDELIRLGDITGMQENARLAADKLTLSYQQLRQHYQDKEKISVFYQLWHDPLRTVGSDNWNQSLIEDCNGQNLFQDTDNEYPLVSLEQVLLRDPQVIIIPHHSGDVGAKTGMWQNWPQLQAVSKQRIFTIDGDLLHRFGPRAIEGLEALCQAIDSARQK